jgi:D-serine deaminase-like pyridoxal phosphate-dependent protein
MSRDRGTSKQTRDFGYGLPCTLDGTPLDGYMLIGANQEHGILARADGDPAPDSSDLTVRFPVGTRLRILPNHACATGAQFPEYHALLPTGELAVWGRFHGW